MNITSLFVEGGGGERQITTHRALSEQAGRKFSVEAKPQWHQLREQVIF